MAEYVADDFRICARVDLPSRVAVSEYVSADNTICDAGSPSILTNLEAYGGCADTIVRKVGSHEERARFDVERAPSANIGC
jgi:hypothetical protein